MIIRFAVPFTSICLMASAAASVVGLVVGLFSTQSVQSAPAIIGVAAPVVVAIARPADERSAWAVDLAAAVGNTQPSAELVAALVTWQIAEDGCLQDCGDRASAHERHNPLNTTQTGYNEVSVINSHGVRGYATYQDGLAATVRTLQYQNNGYEAIVAAIRANDASGMLEAVAVSKWCWQCYSGAAGLLALYGNQAPQAFALDQAKCLPTQSGIVGANYYTTGDVWASIGQPGGQHFGTDYQAAQGQPVFAPFAFTVDQVGGYSDPARSGSYVQGRFTDGTLVYLGHLQNVTVQVGQQVAACTQIGEIGTLAHTHIKIAPPNAPVPCEGSGTCIDFEQYYKEH